MRRTPTIPSAVEIQAALDGLEDHRDAEGTLALYDAVYHVLCAVREGEDPQAAVDEIRDALARFPAHPAHTGVAGSFGLSVQTKTASLEDLLATLPGTSLDPDPVARMRRYLHEQAEIRHLLERRVEELLYRMDRTAFLTNVLAGACVALGFVAILGWMGAFGVFEVLGPETPTLQPPGTPQNVASPGAPASTPAAAPRKEKQP